MNNETIQMQLESMLRFENLKENLRKLNVERRTFDTLKKCFREAESECNIIKKLTTDLKLNSIDLSQDHEIKIENVNKALFINCFLKLSTNRWKT